MYLYSTCFSYRPWDGYYAPPTKYNTGTHWCHLQNCDTISRTRLVSAFLSALVIPVIVVCTVGEGYGMSSCLYIKVMALLPRHIFWKNHRWAERSNCSELTSPKTLQYSSGSIFELIFLRFSLLSLASSAREYNLVRPTLHNMEENVIKIEAGRYHFILYIHFMLWQRYLKSTTHLLHIHSSSPYIFLYQKYFSAYLGRDSSVYIFSILSLY